MYNGLYRLPNNREIKLSEIYKIDKIRDIGEYNHEIYFFKWIFQIILINGDKINIEESYHYNNWGEARIKLEKTRNNLVNEWEKHQLCMSNYCS
jgi:hypothetical protein